MDLGLCPDTQRPNEAYDTELDVLVCADCAMFGKSVGHKLVRPEEAVTNIRERFDQSLKDGFLKREHTEGVLTDIRDALNTCEQNKNRVLKEADALIKELIWDLYLRKEEVTNMITEYFENQKKLVLQKEAEWVDRQQTAEKLREFASSKESEEEILRNAPYISEGLDKISVKPQHDFFEMISSLDHSMHVDDDEKGVRMVDITHNHLKRLIK